MKLLIALDDDNEYDSKLSEHFGHCPFFALYDTEDKELDIVKNDIDHANQELTPIDQIMKHDPDIVFSKGMGKRAMDLFNEKNVSLKTGEYSILSEVIENIDDLEELDSGCAH